MEGSFVRDVDLRHPPGRHRLLHHQPAQHALAAGQPHLWPLLDIGTAKEPMPVKGSMSCLFHHLMAGVGVLSIIFNLTVHCDFAL